MARDLNLEKSMVVLVGLLGLCFLTSVQGCNDAPQVQHGMFLFTPKVSPQSYLGIETATLQCEDGYTVEPLGAGTVVCVDNIWKGVGSSLLPYCLERTCAHPPSLVFGSSEIEGSHASNGEFKTGTNVTYSCAPGFLLIGNEMQVCKNGVWSGKSPICVQSICEMPPATAHCLVKIQSDGGSQISTDILPGSVANYFCYPGYELVGTQSLSCDVRGSWKPELPPNCVPREDSSCKECCPKSNNWPHSEVTVIQGTFSSQGALPGTVVDLSCSGGFRDKRSNGCNITVARMRCNMGMWVGTAPDCGRVSGCYYPPPIVNGFSRVIGSDDKHDQKMIRKMLEYPDLMDESEIESHGIGTNVVYSCRKGYWLRGSSLLVCRENGCWDPPSPPVCVGDSTLFGRSEYEPDEASSATTLLISVGTACCVVCLLAIVWLLVVCTSRAGRHRSSRSSLPSRRRRSSPALRSSEEPSAPLPAQPNWPWGLLCLRGASVPSTPVPTPSEGSQSSGDPDRLALIAFADGLQVSLPSYEDAVRERAPPPYEAVVGTFRGIVRSTGGSAPFRSIRSSLNNSRRSRTSGAAPVRNADRMDADSVSQHSALSGPFWQIRCGGGSIRTVSNAGSIGSLDTVAASEVSGLTGVTHASDATSSSAFSAVSQTPSTRAVCGSLASFDSSSIQNMEGVPLLEENELEPPFENGGLQNVSQIADVGPK